MVHESVLAGVALPTRVEARPVADDQLATLLEITVPEQGRESGPVAAGDAGGLHWSRGSAPTSDRQASAYKWLQTELDRVPSGIPLASPLQKPRFADYAVSLLERKLAKGNIKSAMGREKWLHTLEHLIKGTKGVLGFGEMFMPQIRCEHLEQWQLGIADLIGRKTYAPTTANSWLTVLKVIFKAAKRELGLTSNPTEGIECFDASEHTTYTEEEPNALDAEEAQRFLTGMRDEFPQHYAMTFLGLVNGEPKHEGAPSSGAPGGAPTSASGAPEGTEGQ